MTVFEAGLNQGLGKAMSGQSGELRTGGGGYGFKQGPSGLTDGLCDPRRFESRPGPVSYFIRPAWSGVVA